MADTDNQQQAERYNTGKAKWSLVHFASLIPMVQVLEFGAKKYTQDYWKKGFPREQILESMQRHLAALFDGEETDGESGLSHMGHIMCNAMFYTYHYILKKKEAINIAENKYTVVSLKLSRANSIIICNSKEEFMRIAPYFNSKSTELISQDADEFLKKDKVLCIEINEKGYGGKSAFPNGDFIDSHNIITV